MERFWKRREDRPDLEVELRAHRPVARDEFVRAMGDRVRVSRRSRSTIRVAFTAGLTALAVVALGAFGGLGYAAAGVEHAASTAKRAFEPSSTPPATNRNPARDQYKTTICHRTGSKKKPFVEITVRNDALPAHQRHGDIIPAPPGGCPKTVPKKKKRR